MKSGRTLLFILLFCLTKHSFAQINFARYDSIPVIQGNDTLKNPWTGGLNFCQPYEIDLNMDGIKDLFIFDRQGILGARVTTFLNTGTANKVCYVHAPQYEPVFNALMLHDWVVLADYNCDGKADIFSYNNGSISVYKNTSTPGNLSFTLMTKVLDSYYGTVASSFLNLYVSPVDIPAISDVDNDGDLDVITYELGGQYAEFHKNLTMETYGVCDSLNQYHRQRACFGSYSDGLGCVNYITENLSSCNLYSPPPPSTTGDTTIGYPKHSGTCLLCLDQQGTHVKDLVIGHVSCTSLTCLKNTGDTATAHFNGVDYSWPSYDIPVSLNIFACGFLLDVDNDGKKDILACANQIGASENANSLLWYKNVGTNDSIVLRYQQNNFLQDNMIDVGEGAYPVLHDYDGDGLADLFIGNYGYFGTSVYASKIALYKNIGTNTHPKFSLVTRDFANIHLNNPGILGMTLSFADMDGDGDADLVIGDYAGNLYYFEKLAGPPDNYAYQPTMFSGFSAGQFASPQFYDVNRDGLIDLVVGNRSGRLYYYQNTGTTTVPVFSSTPTNSFLGGVTVVKPPSVTGYACPFFYNEAGSTSLLVGTETGYIYKYGSIDGNLNGNFTKLDTTLPKLGMHITEGLRSAPYGYDIDGDGLMDLFVGNYSGGLEFYKGENVLGIAPIDPEENFDFGLYPNPSQDEVMITIDDFKGSEKYTLTICDLLGRTVLNQPLNYYHALISTSAFSAGTYICSIHSNKAVVHHKLIVRK
jgi:hypothetical protein